MSDLYVFSNQPVLKVHWDHVGDPRDFPNSTFVVGHGSLDVLHGRSTSLRGSHSFFEADLLDPSRTIQLSKPKDTDPAKAACTAVSTSTHSSANFLGPWRPLNELPSTLDVFQDGSLYIVDAPGHLPGHINLLARIGEDSWIYLAGDACHDRRIMRKEREIGEWLDNNGRVCCIHADRAEAEETIQRIKHLEESGVEVVFAHDVEWESDPKNRGRFFGTKLESPGQ